MEIVKEPKSLATKRIEDWMSRLIDLTRRNNLLYFRRTRRGDLSVSKPDSKTIFNRLILRGGRWKLWLPPEETPEQLVEPSNTIDDFPFHEVPPTARDSLICESSGGADLGRTLKNLYRRSLSDYRERGLRILYAAFGMLVWKEIAGPEEIRSPLILVPIEITRQSIIEPFFISVPPVEENVILNPALQVKLKNDFKIELPSMPEEWESDSLSRYFDMIAEAVKDFGWRLEQKTEIGLFSFHKLVIYKDLETNAELIAQHPIVRAISNDKSANLVLDSLPEEKDVDQIEEPQNTFNVLDADSSQRLCIDYALRGQSFVMQGPPGTGKSQTIANVIAECVAKGRSVLFVSDKIAALEVVYQRLSAVGLSRFCLELHSHKANKQEVVAELRRNLDENLMPSRLPSADDYERLSGAMNELNGYVISLHMKRPPLGRSAYDVLSELAHLEDIPLIPITLQNPRELTPQALQELEQLMMRLKNVWQVVEEPNFPWKGFKGYDYTLELRSELANSLDRFASSTSALKAASARFASLLGLDPPSSLLEIEWLVATSSLLISSPGPMSHWVTSSEIDKIMTEAKTQRETCVWRHSIGASLSGKYDASIFALPLGRSAELVDMMSILSKLTTIPDEDAHNLLLDLERLLVFARETRQLLGGWLAESTELGGLFGFGAEEVTVERVEQLVRLASLCDSRDKPESGWLDRSGLERAQKEVNQIKERYTERNSMRSGLARKYRETIYELGIDELVRRYRGSYKSFTRYFRPSFYQDQKRIARASLGGSVPESVLSDLLTAQRVITLETETRARTEQDRNTLGRFYEEYETDFLRVENAISTASEIIDLSKTSCVPEELVELVLSGSASSLRVQQLSSALGNSLRRWTHALDDLSSLIPSRKLPGSALITQTPLTVLQKWARSVEECLKLSYEHLKEVVEKSGDWSPTIQQLMDDLKNAENLRRKEASLLEQEPSLQRLFGSRFQGLATDWEEILSTLDWTKKLQEFFGSHSIPDLFAELVSQGADAAPPNSELVLLYNSVLKDGSVLESRFDDGLSYDGKKLQESSIEAVSLRIEELRNRVESLQTWIDYKHMVDSFCQKGLTNFIDQLIKAKPSSSQLKDILHKTVDHEWVRAICAEDLNLARFRREDHEQLVADFRNLDRRLIRLSPSRVVQAANGRKPREIWITAKDSEIGALMKESAKRRRLLPIRKLFEMIPNLLFRLKPCLLMSPMSVSQFISPELMKFDIVLFDEASQIVPEDAVGAIYRGKTIVVAGDNRQLPPTPFFQKSAIEDYDWDEVSDDEVEVFDSILDECLGIGLPVKTLNWHYRSRHEELIAFSNDRFYENRLTTFPTAFSEDEELGVKLVHVPDGIYDRGGRRDNVKEAEVVTGLVFEHFRRYPEKSLGVVTFSISQMEAVDDAIELGLESQPELEQFFKGDRLQGFFVKNLENVQGDERDVIIFSVGYGRDLQGQMTMNFGPLNKLGGERRLNVAITRAKQKVILVASIKASDIDLKTAGAAGVLALKSYLEYAEKGIEVLDRTCQTQKGEEYESPLEEEVAAEIRRMGYEVVPQVGCSGYRIDLGVLDPLNSGRFVLGVECDGATYRSAHSARDRERLRQQMLENLGWKIHRIWTPSWVNLRESEVRRLRKAIEDACHSQPEGREPVSIASDSDLLQQNGITVQKAFPVGFEKIGVPYVTCRLKASFSPNVRVRIRRWPYQAIHRNQFHYSVNRAEQTRLLAILVKEEGPIHFDCAVQRLTAAWGLKRAGPNIVRAVREAVSSCCQTGLIEIKGDFLWPPTHKEIAVRMPVPDVPESMRRLEHIPPEEIEKAMQLIVTRAVGISVDSLVVETARIFGFSRTGNDIRAILVKVCQKMLQDGALICKDSILTSTRIQL